MISPWDSNEDALYLNPRPKCPRCHDGSLYVYNRRYKQQAFQIEFERSYITICCASCDYSFRYIHVPSYGTRYNTRPRIIKYYCRFGTEHFWEDFAELLTHRNFSNEADYFWRNSHFNPRVQLSHTIPALNPWCALKFRQHNLTYGTAVQNILRGKISADVQQAYLLPLLGITLDSREAQTEFLDMLIGWIWAFRTWDL